MRRIDFNEFFVSGLPGIAYQKAERVNTRPDKYQNGAVIKLFLLEKKV